MQQQIVSPPSIQKKPRKRMRRLWIGIAYMLLVIACGGAAFGGYYLAHEHFGATATLLDDQDGNAVITEDEGAIEHISNQVAPSVVSIVTQSGGGMFGGGGAGTGIVISSDGYVMTNRHVISSASNVAVVAYDGTRYNSVEVVGSDPLNDIAFLRIRDVSGLTPATLGDSGSVRVGQRVVAIGNALGQYQNSVTSGIISGTGRPVVASGGGQTEQLNDLIQTDAAINSGNSGGPLVNMSGQVIGINTAVATDGQGVGFAIPVNATRGMVEGLLETGRVERAYIGVQYVDITPEVAQEEELSVERGAHVTTQRGGSPVASGSPAHEAGIESGDIITHVNGDEVGARGSLGSLISRYRPGTEVTVTLVRGGDTREITLTLAAYDD